MRLLVMPAAMLLVLVPLFSHLEAQPIASFPASSSTTPSPATLAQQVSHQALGTPITSLPYTITSNGRYFLPKTLVGSPGEHGVVINASHVTLDLSGQGLIGVPGTGTGVLVGPGSNGYVDIEITNGFVADWSGAGIDALFARNCRLTNLRVFGSGQQGVRVDQGIVSSCLSMRNGVTTSSSVGHGFDLGQTCVVDACVAWLNRGSGFKAGRFCVITGSTATSNQLRGFDLDDYVTISQVNASGNGGEGIFLGRGGSLSQFGACVNVGVGVVGVSDCAILNGLAIDNLQGQISPGSGSTVAHVEQ